VVEALLRLLRWNGCAEATRVAALRALCALCQGKPRMLRSIAAAGAVGCSEASLTGRLAEERGAAAALLMLLAPGVAQGQPDRRSGRQADGLLTPGAADRQTARQTVGQQTSTPSSVCELQCASITETTITETNRIHSVLFGVQNRTLGPYLVLASVADRPHGGGRS
jgi:hypothetical protein